MFIRWIERPSKTPGYDETALSLILAETKRIDGKPRQQHIAYLGGITDEQIANLVSRCYFWDSVNAAFDRLGNQVTADDRQRFEKVIAARVPRPSPSAYKKAARQVAQRWGWTDLTDGFKAVLADEADQWKARDGERAAELAAMLAEYPQAAPPPLELIQRLIPQLSDDEVEQAIQWLRDSRANQ